MSAVGYNLRLILKSALRKLLTKIIAAIGAGKSPYQRARFLTADQDYPQEGSA